MFAWLRDWLGGLGSERGHGESGLDAEPVGVSDKAGAARRVQSRAASRTFRLAAWSGLELPDAPPPDAGDDAQVAALVPLVKAHFAAQRPDPASFPALATRVIDLVEKPDVDVNKLVNMISQDSAISAKVLNVANSVAYRRSAEVQDLRAAVTLLGLREVANIAVGVAGRSLFDMEARAEFEVFARHWNRLYHQSMTTAFASGWLAIERRARSDHAFLAGMFHDIGKSIALRSLSSLVVNGKLSARCSDRVAERVIDEVHVELGVQMHSAWKMPRFLTFVCQHHHAPRAEARPEYVVLHVVRVASGLNLLRWGHVEDLDVQIKRSIAALGLGERQVRALGAQILDYADRVATMFNIPVDADGPAQKAKEQLFVAPR